MINFLRYIEDVLVLQFDTTYQTWDAPESFELVRRYWIDTTEEEIAKGCREEKVVHETVFKYNKESKYELPLAKESLDWINYRIGVLDFMVKGEYMFKHIMKIELINALKNQFLLKDFELTTLKRTCLILDFLTTIRDEVYKDSYAREIDDNDRMLFKSCLASKKITQ